MMSVVWLASLNAPAAQLLFDNFSSTNTSMWGYSNTGGAALSITNGNLFPRTTTTGANQRALVASVSNNFDFFTTPMSITLDVTWVSGGNAGGTNVFADRYVMITTGGGSERNYINGSAGASVFASIARNGGTNLLQVGMIGTNGNFYTSQTAYTGDVTQMVVTFNSAGYSITGSGTNGFSLSGSDITALWGSNIQFIAQTNWNANGFRLTTGVSNRGNQDTTNTARYNQIEVNSLPYTINSNNVTFTPATNESVAYNWAISGSNSLIVNGAGTVTVGGSNSFSNGTTVNGSTLVLGNANALGSGAVTVSNGALTVGSYTITNSLTNAGGTVSSTGRLGNLTASGGTTTLGGSSNAIATISGSATVNVTGADTTVAAMTGGTLSIDASGAVMTNYTGGDIGISNSRTLNVLSGSSSGTVSGAGGLTKSGSGTLILSGNNSFSGGFTISGGTLQVGSAGSSGTVGSGNVTNSAGALVFNRSDAVSVANIISGGGSLTQAGSGTVTLTATNTYMGATTVSNGKLVVNGSIASSAVNVANGGALGGSGLAGTTTIQSGGTIAPGNSPGTLSITGNLVWNSGANYDWEILNLADAPGTNWDLINVSGALDLTNIAGPFNINLYTLSGTNTFGSLAGFTNTASYAWKILAAGTAIGSFSTNKFTINTANFVNDISGGLFALELRNGDKDLYLTYKSGSPIPEPGTWAAATLLLGTAGFVGLRRRKRSKTRE